MKLRLQRKKCVNLNEAIILTCKVCERLVTVVCHRNWYVSLSLVVHCSCGLGILSFLTMLVSYIVGVAVS